PANGGHLLGHGPNGRGPTNQLAHPAPPRPTVARLAAATQFVAGRGPLAPERPIRPRRLRRLGTANFGPAVGRRSRHFGRQRKDRAAVVFATGRTAAPRPRYFRLAR